MRRVPSLLSNNKFMFCSAAELGKPQFTKEEWEAKQKEWNEIALKRN